MSERALLWRHFRIGWRGRGLALAWLLVGSALVAAGQGLFTGLWKVVLDGVSQGRGGQAGVLLVVVGVAQALLYMLVQGTRTEMNAHIQRVTRDRVFQAMTRAGPGELDRFRGGDLVARLTDDLSEDKLSWFLCSGIFRAYEAVLVAIACLVGMIWIDPLLTLWCLSPLPVLVFFYMGIGPRVSGRMATVQRAISVRTTIAQDAFEGVRVLQARGLTGLATRAFRDASAAQAEAEVSSLRIQTLMFLLFSHGWQLALVALILGGGSRLASGEVSGSDLVVVAGFLLTLVFQTFDFAAFVVRGKVAATSLARLEELLELPAHQPPPSPLTVRLPARLSTPHLDFELGEGLELCPGELVALTGPVGAGKSTLMRVLAGQVGELPMPRAAWVPQDPIVLSVTIAENIALGSDRQLEEAVHAARLGADLARWPDGLQTAVGERGTTLSGGQQQRVQLARALADDAPLVLLDDATSALDADTEGRFWDGLDRAGRLFVVVTHRPATLARASRVLYLRDGRLVASGSHAELLRQVPEYRAAYG